MPSIHDIAWLPLAGGLTAAGLMLSWLAWRRRGVAAGLRGVALSLLPLAAYLTGVLELVWRVGAAAVDWVTRLVFSPLVWAGVGMFGLAFVLYVVAGRLPAGGQRREVEPPAARPSTGSGDGDDLAEIEQILRRRGIT